MRFDGEFPAVSDAPVGRGAYAERIVAGGYPEAVHRMPRRRERFFESYVDTIIQRDLRDIARVHDQANVRRLLEALAAISGSLTNFDSLSRDLGINANMLRSHADLLETLFLVTRLPAWHSNRLNRVIRTPKVHISDSGLLCSLAAIDAARLQSDGPAAGMVFETFVAMELARQVPWQSAPVRLYHYRDREKREVVRVEPGRVVILADDCFPGPLSRTGRASPPASGSLRALVKRAVRRSSPSWPTARGSCCLGSGSG